MGVISLARLSDKLVKEFVRMTNDTSKKKSESFLYGTVDSIEEDGTVNVILDGSDIPTPCSASVSVAEGDRVLLMLKNRQGVITSNISRPSMAVDYLETGDAVIKGHLSAVDGTFLGTLEFDWQPGTQMEASVKIGSEVTAPFIIESGVEGDDASTSIYTDMIQIGKNGGMTWAQMDIYDGFNWSSDKRIKNDIKSIDPSLALKLHPVSFKFVNQPDNKLHYGFIAQEVEPIIPDLISESDSGTLGLNYMGFIAPILATVQHQQVVIEDLERRVKELESKCNKELSD